jgi:fructokinase
MGGTTIGCAVSVDGRHVESELRFATGTDPTDALRQVVGYFRAQEQQRGPLAAIGVGAFGPVDLDWSSATYGCITSTPKPGWAGTDVLGTLSAALPGIPIVIDLDVNAAALGEQQHGAGVGVDSLVYLTVGTGIGGGALVGGRLVHGLLHPEMGHLRVPRAPGERAGFDGICPFHGGCLEGMASGPAVATRWGRPGERLPGDHPAWDLEAWYLAVGLQAIVCVLSPQRIVLGGGVGRSPYLLDRVRQALVDLLGGYLRHPMLEGDGADYVVAPALGAYAGLVGAFALAAAGGRGPG